MVKSYFLFIALALVPTILPAQTCNYPSHKDLSQKVHKELDKSGLNCHPNPVHLTFDDGPHATNTPLILDDLNLRKVNGTFFVTTTLLEGKQQESSQKILNQMKKGNHVIASHGYLHNAYDLRLDREGRVLEEGFTEKQREEQIQKASRLLNQQTDGSFSKQKNLVFRFPYGRGAMPSKSEIQYMHDKGLMQFQGLSYAERIAEYRRQSPALVSLAENGLSHLGWNHDSNDSSYGNRMPTEDVLVKYIATNVKNLCKSKGAKVALFHDLKDMNTKAIGSIIDVGRCLGLKFVGLEEILKDKSLSTGVYIPKESVYSNTMQTVEEILKVTQGAGSVQCLDDTKIEALTCYSDYTKKEYLDCEGASSVCYQGRWYSKEDPVIEKNCSQKCYSEYTKKFYSNCQGEGSVCFNGKWHSRDDQVIKNQCRAK